MSRALQPPPSRRRSWLSPLGCFKRGDNPNTTSLSRTLWKRVVDVPALLKHVRGELDEPALLQALSFANEAGRLIHTESEQSPVHRVVVTDLAWVLDAIKRVVSPRHLLTRTHPSHCNADWCHLCGATFRWWRRRVHCSRCRRSVCRWRCSETIKPRSAQNTAPMCVVCAKIVRTRGATQATRSGSKSTFAEEAAKAFFSDKEVEAELAMLYPSYDSAPGTQTFDLEKRPQASERLLCLELWAEFPMESMPVLLHLLRLSGLLVCVQSDDRDGTRVSDWLFKPRFIYIVPCLLPSTLPDKTWTWTPRGDVHQVYRLCIMLDALPPSLFADLVSTCYTHTELDDSSKRVGGGWLELSAHPQLGERACRTSVTVRIGITTSGQRPHNINVLAWSPTLVQSPNTPGHAVEQSPRWEVFHVVVKLLRQRLEQSAPGLERTELVPCPRCCEDERYRDTPRMLPVGGKGPVLYCGPALNHHSLRAHLTPPVQDSPEHPVPSYHVHQPFRSAQKKLLSAAEHKHAGPHIRLQAQACAQLAEAFDAAYYLAFHALREEEKSDELLQHGDALVEDASRLLEALQSGLGADAIASGIMRSCSGTLNMLLELDATRGIVQDSVFGSIDVMDTPHRVVHVVVVSPPASKIKDLGLVEISLFGGVDSVREQLLRLHRGRVEEYPVIRHDCSTALKLEHVMNGDLVRITLDSQDGGTGTGTGAGAGGVGRAGTRYLGWLACVVMVL